MADGYKQHNITNMLMMNQKRKYWSQGVLDELIVSDCNPTASSLEATVESERGEIGEQQQKRRNHQLEPGKSSKNENHEVLDVSDDVTELKKSQLKERDLVYLLLV